MIISAYEKTASGMDHCRVVPVDEKWDLKKLGSRFLGF
jgi:hypothetical protein